MVQVSLESLAAEGPGVPPEGAHDAKGLVEHIVNLEDDEGDEVVDVKLFHDYLMILRISYFQTFLQPSTSAWVSNSSPRPRGRIA